MVLSNDLHLIEAYCGYGRAHSGFHFSNRYEFNHHLMVFDFSESREKNFNMGLGSDLSSINRVWCRSTKAGSPSWNITSRSTGQHVIGE